MEIRQLKIKKGKEMSLYRKHPWVFSGAIAHLPEGIADGDVVEVRSYDQKLLGIGHFQGGGSIAVRILSFEQIAINQHFWNDKIANAVKYRKSLGLPSADTDTYRLIHGEGDGLPGLIIDIYHNIAVIQVHSIGIHRHANEISYALTHSFGDTLETIYLRCRDTLPDHYSATVNDVFIKGDTSTTLVCENGVSFKIDIVTGQKTGFFLDQRENRALIKEFAHGKSILNCFCYTGGFSLYALKAGAKEVVSVDISQKAVDLMEENIKLNTFGGVHISHCANVMAYLNDDSVPQYDVVVVDPPAFAKSLHKRHNAVQAYKRLNVLALNKVKNGGFLFTYSCSQVVGTQLFYDTIVAAGIESGKNVRVVRSLSQGPDHPINLFHPEGHYLKGLMLFVE